MIALQTTADKSVKILRQTVRVIYSKGYGKMPTIQDIKTWKEYSGNSQLPKKIDTLPDVNLDNSKNAVLADKISIFEGDITTLQVDAIVNAANSSLRGGGGVDGAIHRKAGPELLKECITLNGCAAGEAKVTKGYKLPAKHVIHTVGPYGEKTNILQGCYKNSLDIMLDVKLRTIAFPCIATGIYGYPNLPAAHVASREVRKHLEKNHDAVDRVIFCVFLPEDKVIYEGILQSYFPTQ
ncbi:unnamed protein product [Brassicogethes aeneus]|uniref:Macro domain-containing protein n=1 Tax=Brassicogethes aeneus TaxID=1431903 RepID=A0A9P0B6Q8_BRAAE|nr:unnamed protein product [Brassicogethes aeneus]